MEISAPSTGGGGISKIFDEGVFWLYPLVHLWHYTLTHIKLKIQT